jgi:hypothetical protein
MATRLVSRARMVMSWSGEGMYVSVRPCRSGIWMEWKPERSASTASSMIRSIVSAAFRRPGIGWSYGPPWVSTR